MFKCPQCNQNTLRYDYKQHRFHCPECNHEELAKSKDRNCFRCGTLYKEYTWFDPSGCVACNKSFVD